MQYGKQPKTLPCIKNKAFDSCRISSRKINKQENNCGRKSSKLDRWVRWRFRKATSLLLMDVHFNTKLFNVSHHFHCGFTVNISQF